MRDLPSTLVLLIMWFRIKTINDALSILPGDDEIGGHGNIGEMRRKKWRNLHCRRLDGVTGKCYVSQQPWNTGDDGGMRRDTRSEFNPFRFIQLYFGHVIHAGERSASLFVVNVNNFILPTPTFKSLAE